MATLYNNGSGNQSMGNMGAGLAAGYAEWQKAQLDGDPQAAKRASENYQKAEALKAKPNDIARAEKVGQENSDIQVAKAQEQINNANYTSLDAYENKQTEQGNIEVDTKLLQEYGNNYFELITYDAGLNGIEQGGQLKLAGVLKEVPSFSMTSTWEKGPASTISDKVKGYFTNPLLEMAITIGSRDRSWMSLDEGTDRMYKSTNRPSFSLSFKLYTNEVIGSEKLTNYKTWIKALSLYTMPSIASKTSINAMANNTFNGIVGVGSQIKSLFEDVAKGLSDTTTTNESTKEKEIKSDESIITSITDAINKNVDKVGNTIKTTLNNAGNRLTQRDGENRVTNSSNIENYYGAKLWYLRILPGIFRNPLIVYISSWGVTYSKEINPDTLEPIWVEFTLTCEMDQIASAPVWMKYLTGKDYRETIENYETTYKKEESNLNRTNHFLQNHSIFEEQ